jgi:hypothetical protein
MFELITIELSNRIATLRGGERPHACGWTTRAGPFVTAIGPTEGGFNQSYRCSQMPPDRTGSNNRISGGHQYER